MNGRRHAARARPATKSGSRRGSIAAKSAARFCLIACSLLLTACPPKGGDLVPVARSEDAILLTSAFERDTLSITRNGISLRARGVWSVADGNTSVILAAANSNTETAKLEFGNGEMTIDVSGTRLLLRSVKRENDSGGQDFLSDKTAVLGTGSAGKFVLEYVVESEDGRSGVTRDLLGQTATLRVPVEFTSTAPSRVEFVLGFKYAEKQGSR